MECLQSQTSARDHGPWQKRPRTDQPSGPAEMGVLYQYVGAAAKERNRSCHFADMQGCNTAVVPTLQVLVVPTWVPEVVHKCSPSEGLHEEEASGACAVDGPGAALLWQLTPPKRKGDHHGLKERPTLIKEWSSQCGQTCRLLQPLAFGATWHVALP